MKYGIYVGTTPEAVKAALSGILAIIDRKPDPSVAVEALKTFSTLCGVGNTTISNNYIGASPVPKDLFGRGPKANTLKRRTR